MAVIAVSPWLQLPDIAGANIYRYVPSGAVQVPAIIYSPDTTWIDRRETYRTWLENYVAVCLVLQSAQSAVQQLYELALSIKSAIDEDPALSSWEWKGAGGIVRREQAGMEYLACAVRLSFSATY